MTFDRDAPLALQIHRVEKLILHLTLADGVGALQQAITQRGLAMVDVRNNAEISDLRGIHFLAQTKPQKIPQWLVD